jgi:glycosyltransferase involved in cell wall biosynthesis
MEEARTATGAVAKHVHILGEVPYAQVRRYYAGASIFVFPSYLETFGHPMLEALASELPVVASDIPVFHEIAGAAALYADPHDAAALSHAMEEALTVPEIREALRKRGRDRLREFGWERAAARLSAVFDTVITENMQRGVRRTGSPLGRATPAGRLHRRWATKAVHQGLALPQ